MRGMTVTYFDILKCREWQRIHTLRLWSTESDDIYTLSHFWSVESEDSYTLLNFEVQKVRTVTHFVVSVRVGSSRTREARPWVRNSGLYHFSSHHRGMTIGAWDDSCTNWYFEMQEVTAVAHFDTLICRKWQQLHTFRLWSAESEESYTLRGVDPGGFQPH